MKRKFRWIDLALLPFGLCVLFLLLLGKLFGLTYKQISVVFNLWVQGAVLALSGLAPFGIAVYKMMESFSTWWLGLSAVLLIYENDHTAIVMLNSASDDNKRLLSKYLE